MDLKLRGYKGALTGLFWTKRCERIAWKGALVMPKERFNAEQIVTLLRQIEVSMARANLPLRLAGMQEYRSRATTAGARNMMALRSTRPSG